MANDPENRKIDTGRDFFERIEGNARLTIYNSVAPDPARHAALQTAYLECLLSTTSRLELTGIDRKAMGHEADAGLDLGRVYTALLTLSSDAELRKMAIRPELPGIDGDSHHRLSALDLLNRTPRLVLLGDPGSGKSTFVKFVAMCLAGELLKHPQVNVALLTTSLPDDQADEKERPQPWDHGALLPVLVILRDFAAKGLPAADQPATARHLWDFLVQELTEMLLGDYAPLLQQHLRKHGGIVLLDGLDEVPEASRRRTQIKQAVEDFSRAFPMRIKLSLTPCFY